MSLTFKLLSLAIRTAAKPIGNYIKRQAKEHEGFRRIAVKQAQRVHQLDMSMRLGILHDADAQQRMHEREQKAAEEKKRKAEVPIVRTEEEQRTHDEEQAKAEKDSGKKKEDKSPKVKIRPLSDAKAIELGANFFSEAFIFAVAAGLLIWDSWRSRRKESARRDDVAERLQSLETELDRLRTRYEPEMQVVGMTKKPEEKAVWWNPAGWWSRTEPDETHASSSGPESIPGNVPVVDPDKAVSPTTSVRRSKAAEAVKDSKTAVVTTRQLKGPDGPASTRVDPATVIKPER